MKKHLLFIFTTISLLVFTSLQQTFAQVPTGYQQVNATQKEALTKRIQAKQSQIKDMQMDFTQEKVMKMMSNKVIMHGQMHFKKPELLKITYKDPIQMMIWMNQGQWAIKENGKINRFSERTMPSLYYINQMLLESVQGAIISSKHFKSTVYEGKDSYFILLKPEVKELKQWFQEIHLFIDKKDVLVQRIILKESDQEHTTMIMKNVKINQNVSNSVFTIR